MAFIIAKSFSGATIIRAWFDWGSIIACLTTGDSLFIYCLAIQSWKWVSYPNISLLLLMCKHTYMVIGHPNTISHNKCTQIYFALFGLCHIMFHYGFRLCINWYFSKVTSLSLAQPHDCPIANEVLESEFGWNNYRLATSKHNNPDTTGSTSSCRETVWAMSNLCRTTGFSYLGLCATYVCFFGCIICC